MATGVKKNMFRTPSGELLSIMPGTEHPSPVDEVIRRRALWREKYGHLLGSYTVAEFLREKRMDIEAGLE